MPHITSGIIEAPKWAGVPAFLKNTGWLLGLDVSVEVDKGVIRETVRFRVKGEEDKLRRFNEIIKQALQD